MFRGLTSYDEPKTYEQIFRTLDSSQVVLVVGEQDNTFTPGGGGTPTAWAGLNEHGVVKKAETKKFTTPVLAAGTYQFDLTGTADADLYVRVGKAPTATSFDCRPYKTGSNESCQVTLAQPASIYAQVRGYAATSNFDLKAGKQ
ncbi:MAG: PPC domain-containing protein [Proteobacteria bacterium]|nr:PPC domain-containing protein [Pseudomonadota bacterium]